VINPYTGQTYVVSSAARLRFDAIADPRFQEWELEDTELAILLGRETLPWTRHLGWFAQMRMIWAWLDRKQRFLVRSIAAQKGWATRRAKVSA